jgi:hypoxanthine phosphoribosyltransferase
MSYQPQQLLANAELLVSADDVQAVLDRLARQISDVLAEQQPLVLAVMGGAVVFTGQLLPRLHFPLDFDYVQVSRYGKQTRGGELSWQKAVPAERVAGRVVLVLDDILDEGETMAAIRTHVLGQGAAGFYSAVLADKRISKPKPLRADFVGLEVPDRYVFGCGMDVHGWWRNLPAIYALKNTD